MLPDDDESKEKEERERSVFSHVGNFFGWLGQLISEQARVEAERKSEVPPVHIMREITLQQQRTSEVIENADTICLHLEEIKQKLTQEFGASSATFISKCIDPMIEHARYLTNALKNPQNGKEKHLNNLLSQAIESVELYSQFSDEKKMKKRIVQVAQGLIKQSIEKDLEVLSKYKVHALDAKKLRGEEREFYEFKIDGYLYPIISELIGMGESRLITDDLHAFFVWKANVDERRNSLVELGLLTIDAMTNPEHEQVAARPISADDDDEVVLEEPFPELVKHQLEASAIAMSYLSTLEDRVNDIFSRLGEDLPIDQIEPLLEYLKLDAERFQGLSNQTKHVLDSFNELRENILRAEQLISSKKE